MLYEVRYQFGVMITYGNDDIVVCNDADGHSDKRDAVLVALHRNAQNGQQPVAFGLRARTFVRIGYVFKECFGNFQLLGKELEIVVVRALHVYPAVRFPFGFFYEAVFAVEILSHCFASFL